MPKYIDSAKIPVGYKAYGPLILDRATANQIIAELTAIQAAEKAKSLALAEEDKVEESKAGFDYALYEVGEEGRSVETTNENKTIPGLTMQIFDMSVIEKRLQHDPSSRGDQDEQRARNKLLQTIAESGAKRRLAQVEVDTETRLDGFQEDFPNFGDVIQYLRGVVAIAHADDRTPQPAHILLNGPPGIGKTLFAQCIANIFGTEIMVAHLETMQTAADLVGTSSHYSNATTGLIFNTLIASYYANPLILLDEIDKATGDDRRPTTSALFNLLESTSKNFRDESEQWLALDASRIIYMATSNEIEDIDPAILSRLKVFEIEAPSREQSRLIIDNIFSGIKSTRPRAFESLRLNESAIEKLLDLSPRKMKAALTTAAGNALIAQRTQICAHDVEDEPERKHPSIGFVS